MFERLGDRSDDCRIAVGKQLIVREGAEQVGEVAVPWLPLDELLVPLHQPAVASDLRRGKQRSGGYHVVQPRIIEAQQRRRIEAAVEEGASDLHVHRRVHAQRDPHTVDDVGVLRRDRGTDQQLPVVLDGEVEEEGGGVLEHRIGAGREEVEVAGVVEVIPQVQCHPGSAERPQPAQCVVERRGVGPQVRVVMGDEAAAVVVHPSGLGAVEANSVEEVEERLVALWETADLGRPVVHLGVDVDRELAVPCRDVHLVPDPLEVRRQRSRSAGTEKQVAPVLEEQGEQSRVVAARSDPLEARLGRERGRRPVGRGWTAVAERDPDSAHHLGVLPDMIGADLCVPTIGCRVDRRSHRRGEVVVTEVGRCRHDDRGGATVAHHQMVADR